MCIYIVISAESQGPQGKICPSSSAFFYSASLYFASYHEGLIDKINLSLNSSVHNLCVKDISCRVNTFYNE